MHARRSPERFSLFFLIGILAAGRADAVQLDPLGPNNEAGEKNGISLTVGPGGAVYELDAFFYLADRDLNGAEECVCARLSVNALPAGLVCTATNALTADATDLVLTYAFGNNGADVFQGLRFFSFLDAEIDEESNTFFNEYGATAGTPGSGSGDSDPDYWQIDEPGFQGGTLMPSMINGQLAQLNAVPANDPDDVSMALGFELGPLLPGELATVRIMISEDGSALGNWALRHHDTRSADTVITYSGQAEVLPQLTDLVVVGADRLLGGESTAYQCLAHFSDGAANDVTAAVPWSFRYPAPAGIALESNVLHTVPVQSDVPVALQTVYTFRDVTLTGRLDVTVMAVEAFVNVTGKVSLSFSWQLNYSTGALVGTLQIRNRSQAALRAPFKLAMGSHADYFYASPDGRMPDGSSFIDLTQAVNAALRRTGDRDLLLDPAETVSVAGFEVYSRARISPPASLFRLWSNYGAAGQTQ